MQIAVISMVRNEADIIEMNYHPVRKSQQCFQNGKVPV